MTDHHRRLVGRATGHPAKRPCKPIEESAQVLTPWKRGVFLARPPGPSE